MMKPQHILTAIIMACAAGISLTAYSQDVNPTVEVSRAYRAKHIAVDKPAMEMPVPDSVMRFDIDVDYTVRDSPYEGSYEFRPYMLDIRPEASADDSRRFFIRLGAGYPLHPTADLSFSPDFRTKSFSLNVYGTHRSYAGRYRAVSSDGIPGGAAQPVLTWDRSSMKRYSGYDSYTRAGVSGRTDWKSGYFSFDLGYLGYARKDTLMTGGFDAFKAGLRVASRNSADRYFLYDIAISYLYGEDKVTASGPAYMTEHDFSLYARLGPVFSKESMAVIDLEAEVSDYGSYFSALSGRFSLTPHYMLDRGRWNLDLGAEISVLLGNDMTEYALPGRQINPRQMHSSRGQYVYPDIEIGFDAVRNYLNVYLKADGGDMINRYSDLLARDARPGLLASHSQYGLPLMDNTSERLNARLGLRGNIGSRFIYDLGGGYVMYKNYLADAVVEISPDIFGTGSFTVGSGLPLSVSSALYPAVSYVDCNMWYVDFSIGWHSENLTADARLAYLGTDMRNQTAAGFTPAPFSADADVVYNWKKRIYVGLHCNASFARHGYMYIVSPGTANGDVTVGKSSDPVRIPGYADLGLSAEYRFNRKASFWLYGGNLLDMTIQRSPLYCESGIYFIAGITVSL